MEFIKVSDYEIRVKKTETKEVENVYDLRFLLEQRKTIQAQKDREIAQRDLELAEVDKLIAECEKLGIKEKEKEEDEPIKEEETIKK